MGQQKQNKMNSLKRELARLFFIGVGVFLFILFFQPFPLESLDYNNRLLYVTGFGIISFLLCFFVLVLIQLVFPKWNKIEQWDTMHPLGVNIFLLIITGSAYAFYIKYVGNTSLSLYILLKIFLISLLPIIILGILYKNKSLEQENELLKKQNSIYLDKIKQLEKKEKDEIVEIISDDKNENLRLKYKNIIVIKSADNYIKISYLKNEKVEMQLIRSTLKSIESLLMHKSQFVRCHRTCIVNIDFVEKMHKNYSGYNLEMNLVDEDIPVSRQYISSVKQVLSKSE